MIRRIKAHVRFQRWYKIRRAQHEPGCYAGRRWWWWDWRFPFLHARLLSRTICLCDINRILDDIVNILEIK